MQKGKLKGAQNVVFLETIVCKKDVNNHSLETTIIIIIIVIINRMIIIITIVTSCQSF